MRFAINIDLTIKGEITLVVEKAGRHKMVVVFFQTKKQVSATVLAKSAIRPFRRTELSDTVLAFKRHLAFAAN